jgi:hypothetical protein
MKTSLPYKRHHCLYTIVRCNGYEEKLRTEKIDDPVLTPTGAYALFARSFFQKDAPSEGEAAEAIG